MLQELRNQAPIITSAHIPMKLHQEAQLLSCSLPTIHRQFSACCRYLLSPVSPCDFAGWMCCPSCPRTTAIYARSILSRPLDSFSKSLPMIRSWPAVSVHFHKQHSTISCRWITHCPAENCIPGYMRAPSIYFGPVGVWLIAIAVDILPQALPSDALNLWSSPFAQDISTNLTFSW